VQKFVEIQREDGILLRVFSYSSKTSFSDSTDSCTFTVISNEAV